MKNKKTLIIVVVIGIFIVVLGGFFLFGYSKVYNSSIKKLKNLGYSKGTIEEIIKYDIISKVVKSNYSKTLDLALENEDFEKENIDLYLNINYVDEKDFIKNLNRLSNLGYKKTEIKTILSKVEYNNINYILERPYIKNISEYLNVGYLDIKKLDRYINYSSNNKDKDIKSVIGYVNMDMDKVPYIDYKLVENPDSYLVLVNKYNKLDENYKPNDLERINTNYSTKNLYLRKEAKENFESMCRDASSLGLSIRAISSYRTWNYQNSLYDGYVSENGTEKADTYSARPGFSEHETGLATDVMGSNGIYTKFDETNEYTWLINNAHNYGFIIRYPENKEDITKYMFESWHIRYVGKSAAKYIYRNNICLEEYLALKIDQK